MSRITNKGATAPLGLFQTSTDASFITFAGERFDLSDGREVVLVQAGAVALTSGVLAQAPAIVADHQNTAVVASVAVGATQVTVTLGATLASVNQYQGGYAVVNAGPGIGQTLKISSNPAAALSANVVITLEDAVAVALTTASKISLFANPYIGAVINPTTPTNTPIGVTLYPIAISAYGYLITKGPTSLLSDGAIAVGLGISASGSVAGAGVISAATTARIGRALQAAVTAESRMVYVDL